ncbi:hypothetical protein HQ560_06610, partial [bacterium]|nr:hypothetical protein [bacterium]
MRFAALLSVLAFAATSVETVAGSSMRELVEADWLRQAGQLRQPPGGQGTGVPAWADAA